MIKKDNITIIFENFVEEQRKKDLITQIKLFSELLENDNSFYDLQIEITFDNEKWCLDLIFDKYLVFSNYKDCIDIYFKKEDKLFFDDIMIDELSIEDIENLKIELEKLIL